MEELADLCSKLNWQRDAPASMLLIRSSVFGDRYDGLGLCRLEADAAFKHPNSIAMILGYRVFAEAIRQQLEGLRRQRDAREADERRPEWLRR